MNTNACDAGAHGDLTESRSDAENASLPTGINLENDRRHGLEAEKEFLSLCKDARFHAKRMSHASPYDLVVDGWRIEVKSATLKIKDVTPTNKNGVLGWYFNIQRHNKLREECDFYAFRLHGAPEHTWFLFKGPFGVMGIFIRLDQIEKYQEAIANMSLFLHGQFNQIVNISPKIESKAAKISRQFVWQVKRLEAGLCSNCGKAPRWNGRQRCEACLAKQREQKRNANGQDHRISKVRGNRAVRVAKRSIDSSIGTAVSVPARRRSTRATCEHGTARGFHCWRCQGIAVIEK